MANYVLNKVTLTGDKARIFELLEAIKYDELDIGSIDFNKIIPAPVDEDGLISRDWCIANWGTKWNALFEGTDGEVFEISEDSVQIAFETAWSGACPIIEHLAETNVDLCFEHEWADEGIANEECGKNTYSNGQCVNRYFPEGKEAMRFACEVWGFEWVEEDWD